MTASERLVDTAQPTPRSQRRRTAANGAVDSPTSKRTPRATRTPNKTTGLQANSIEDKDTPSHSGKGKKTEAVVTEEEPSALPEGATPKRIKHQKEIKEETEGTQEQQGPQAKATSTNTKRKSKVEENQPPAAPQIDGDTLKTAKRKRAVKVEAAEIEVNEPSPKKAKRKKTTEAEVDEIVEYESSAKKVRRKTKVKEEDEEGQEREEGQKKIKGKRKTKEEKEMEAMPLAARTDGLRMLIGAHVSGAKGRSFSMYIAAVELRLYYESRSSQFSHKLRAYWVNSHQILHR